MINLGKVQHDISHKWRSVLISTRELARLAGDDKGCDLLDTLNQHYPAANDIDTVNAIWYHNKNFDISLSLKIREQVEGLNKIEEKYKGII